MVPPPTYHAPGFVPWVARNVLVIKIVLLAILAGLIAGIAYRLYLHEKNNPDFGTNPPTPTTIGPTTDPTPGTPPPNTSLDAAAIAGAVVGGLAVLALVGYAIYYAIKRAPKTGEKPDRMITNYADAQDK